MDAELTPPGFYPSARNPGPMTTVLLVRHGETEWNRTRRLQGWAPVSLNDRGREQAAAVGEYVAAGHDVDRVVASDLRRCKETARLLRRAGPVDAPVTFARAWRERSVGVFQGFSYDDFYERHSEFALHHSGHAAADATPEGGESFLDLRERVLAGWERLLDDADGETVLVVTHGGPIYVVLAHLKGLDVVAAITEQDQHNCALNELRVDGDGVRVVCENDTTPHE